MMSQEHKASYPLATANGNGRSVAEAATSFSDEELRRQKRRKWILCIITFVIFQTAVIVLFSMTVMTVMKFRTPKFRVWRKFRTPKFRVWRKFRTPKFRVRSATLGDNFQTSNSSFNLKMDARLGVKNTNFGPYKFDNTAIFFYYNGTQVGSAAVRKSEANFRSTKMLDVTVDLISPTSLTNNQQLANDLSSRILHLTSKAEMKGKVTIMFMFKKRKSTKLDCSMEVNTKTKALQNVKCKS